MSYYNRGPDRAEIQLLPACLDDYVEPNCPARFIDAYVEALDLGALGFKHAQPAGAGRPPYHPVDLLKLYIYGYLQRIRSSRRLEAEAGRNLELIWLLRSIRPDFKTIADFRKDNREAFKKLFKQFNLLCRKLDLFGAELVAIDGAKFKAVNNSRRYCTEGQLQELIKKIESRIEEYLGEMDRQDGETQGVPAGPSRPELEQKVALLKERKGAYQQMLDELESSGQSGGALTDPDAAKMKGPQGFVIGYNVQVAVDAKHDLIVAQEVVQAATDLNQLAAMAVAAKEQLGVEKLQALADRGYFEADQLESCEKAAVETFVPEPGGSSGMGKGGQRIFPKEQFVYDAMKDTYRCPAGQTLGLARQDTNHSKKRLIYLNKPVCKECALRSQCTTGSYRIIARRINEAVMERAAARAAGRADLVAAHDTFLLRGLAKVRAEFSLSAVVYNLRRLLNIVGIDQLLKQLPELTKAATGAG